MESKVFARLTANARLPPFQTDQVRSNITDVSRNSRAQEFQALLSSLISNLFRISSFGFRN